MTGQTQLQYTDSTQTRITIHRCNRAGCRYRVRAQVAHQALGGTRSLRGAVNFQPCCRIKDRDSMVSNNNFIITVPGSTAQRWAPLSHVSAGGSCSRHSSCAAQL